MDNIPFLHLVLALACAVHCLKSGRSGWWLWLLLMFPYLGPLIYFIAEWLPELRGNAGRRPRKENNRRRIRRLMEEIEVVGTVERRAELADALLAEGDAAEAVRQLRICDNGPHRGDAFILMSLIAALLENGEAEEAWQAYQRLEETGTRERPKVRALLRARTLADLGRSKEAREAFLQLDSAEGRCRYGMFLKAQGEAAAASEVFNTLLNDAKRASSIWRRTEREWIATAKRER